MPFSYCINTLKAAGFDAYLVGGCVRDRLLGIAPHDYDLCTSATPEQICRIFAQHTLVRAGEKHGTIGVVVDGQVYEITTFRTEGGYSDNRHPDSVHFVTDIQEDLARRDFTVNAIAYAPDTGVVDPFGGEKDLKDKILRAVGDPYVRFREDALRILRGVRFAVRFGLTPHEQTLAAMLQLAPLMDKLARERILSELMGLLPLVNTSDLITYRPILTRVIPELDDIVDFAQHNPHHKYDIYTHTAHAVAALPQDFSLRFAALLHDVGKPNVFTLDEAGIGHFYKHGQESAHIAQAVMLRLKFPNALQEEILFLIEQHMTLPVADKKFLRRWLGKYGFEKVQKLLLLQKADLIATGTDRSAELETYAEIDRLLAEIAQEDSCLSIRDLAISGKDLLELGFPPGPSLGQCLTTLLEQVLDEAIPNKKQALLSAAKLFQSQKMSD